MINDVRIGATVEKIVRRSGVSVTELASRMHVNRRTVYNWFSQKYLSSKIVKEIGDVIKHDFSIDLPNLFVVESLVDMKVRLSINSLDKESAYYWREKYRVLLEKYNERFEIFTHKDFKNK